jgi:hypothetical protein
MFGTNFLVSAEKVFMKRYVHILFFFFFFNQSNNSIGRVTFWIQYHIRGQVRVGGSRGGYIWAFCACGVLEGKA